MFWSSFGIGISGRTERVGVWEKASHKEFIATGRTFRLNKVEALVCEALKQYNSGVHVNGTKAARTQS
jgi:hypothetical protein